MKIKHIQFRPNKPIRSFRHGLFKCLVLFLTTNVANWGGFQAQATQNPTSPITVESFLLAPRTIQRAVLEKTNSNANHRSPKNPLTTTFYLKCDDTNYFLGIIERGSGIEMPFVNGAFRGISWSYASDSRTLQFNGPIIHSGSVTNLKQLSVEDFMQLGEQFNVNLVRNLGFPNISRTDRVMDKKHKCILSTLNGRPVLLHLTYENGLVASALLEDTKSKEKYTMVRYSYNPQFREGQFPIGFVQYNVSKDGTNPTPLCTVRIDELELSNQPLETSEVDPHTLFRSQEPTFIFASNNIPYEVLRTDPTMRVPTLADSHYKQDSLFSVPGLLGY